MKRYDYDVVVIGGGAAGLSSSGICASFGARTALIERARLGGDCTWYGCVPSKSLLHIAKGIAALKNIRNYGVDFDGISIDFGAVMQSVRKTRQRIYEEADSPEVMAARGVDILQGSAQFQDPHSLELSTENRNQTITFRSAIITAGASPLILPISGLKEAGFLTNETIFELHNRPEHLVILGNGPIGIEMAQAFVNLGSKVTVIALDPRILIRDEPKCAEIVGKRLQAEGVTFHNGETIHEVKIENGIYELAVGPLSGSNKIIKSDALLVAVGRKPNVEELALKNAGVKVEKNGIPVDSHCRTNVKHIFAAGDITTFLKFTHVAENMAKTAAVNAVFRLPLFKYEQDVIPWVTYTEPECAHVGKTAEELTSQNLKFQTIEFPYSKIDRAVTEHAEEGIIILHTSNGKIRGAHAVGTQAGEIINEYALAMKNGIKLSQISDTIHAYPTMLLGARRAADQYYVRLQKKWMSRLIRFIFRYKGEIPAFVGSNEVL
jgi:pyruvate/2-oxoglutarate dehydrogenase complex dihydrolipoamide dehydrogenase (E3) component